MIIQETQEIRDIRFHGRAGQGVVTASRLLGEAAIAEGKWTHAFPNFGPERMGAPVSAFTRISDEKFTVKTEVYNPDFIVIIDPSLIKEPQYYKGLKSNGKVLLNTTNVPGDIRELLKDNEIWVVNGDEISRKYLGRTIANTVMLGALLKVTGIVEKASLVEALKNKFPDELGEKNVKAINMAYDEVRKIEH